MNFTDGALAIRELRAATAAGDSETIARTAMANIWPLFSEHHDDLILIVETLPGPLLDRYPALRLLHPMTPALARTTRPFKPLVHPDVARAMSPDELDVLTLVQMIAFRFSGDVAAAQIYAQRLSDRIQRVRAESLDDADGPRWYYHQQIGATLLAAGDSARALLEFASSRELGRLGRHASAERIALGRTALAHAVRGSLEDAESALDEIAQHPTPDRALRTSMKTTERTARALVGVERMATDTEDLLDRLESYDSVELTWPFALLARSRHLIAQHRPDEAIEAVRLALGAHADQHGSFASDVINSASIDALWALGETKDAREIARSSARSGQLTRFAIVRHALLESSLDVAEQGLHLLSTERSMGPGPRSEWILLSAWLQSARSDAIAPVTARQVARLASRIGLRRLMSMMPAQLIGKVHEHLTPSETAAFTNATVGLTPVDRPSPPVLTASELRVLAALPKYATTAQIAAALYVSPNTIKSQLRSLYRKLGCSTRENAISIGSRHHLLTVEGDR